MTFVHFESNIEMFDSFNVFNIMQTALGHILNFVPGDGIIIEGSGTSGGEGLFCSFMIALSFVKSCILGTQILFFFCTNNNSSQIKILIKIYV